VARRHEIAVRLSLGASRARLLRQLVTESTLLALVGGAVGLMLAWWGLTWMQKTEIDAVNVTPDFGTFAFVLGLALVTGVLFGLSPALHATRTGVANALRDSGTGSTSRSRLQRVFVVAQIMLSMPLLVLLGAVLSVVIGDYRPLSADMSRHVIAVRFGPLERGAPSQRREAVDSLIPRIALRSEVSSVVPDIDAFDIRGIVSRDRDARLAASDSVPTIAHMEGAAPGWFALVDVPIVLGRDVSLADTAAADHPVVIGSDLARRLWGAANPIGRTLTSPPVLAGQDSLTLSVIGVYDATRRLPGISWQGGAATTNVPARVFTARGKHWQRDRVLVRTHGPGAPWLPELQRLLRQEAPAMAVTQMQTLEQADAADSREKLKVVGLAGAGGALALLLASLGLYGVVSLAVQQRTREIGIRIAVGAHPTRVARAFLASGVRLSVLALILGLPLSVAGLQIAMKQGLFIAPEANPMAIGVGIAVVLLVVATGATWIPARRAATVDPVTTLRLDA
jgi:predicted permease